MPLNHPFIAASLLLLATSIAPRGASAEGGLLTAQVCKDASFHAAEKYAEVTSFKIDGVQIVLAPGDGNLLTSLRWKTNGKVEAVSQKRGANKPIYSPMGKGDRIRFNKPARRGAKKCVELKLPLPADEFDLSARQRQQRPQDAFCNGILNYDGPCKVMDIESNATLLIKRTSDSFELHSAYSLYQFKSRGPWRRK